MQLVEVEAAHVVDRLAGDGEEQSGCPKSGALAVGAGALDHHLVQPLFHARVGFATLSIAAVLPFDSPRDSAEADLLAFPIIALDLRSRAAGSSRSFFASRP